MYSTKLQLTNKKCYTNIMRSVAKLILDEYEGKADKFKEDTSRAYKAIPAKDKRLILIDILTKAGLRDATGLDLNNLPSSDKMFAVEGMRALAKYILQRFEIEELDVTAG